MLFSTKYVIQHKIFYSAQNVLFSTKYVIQHKMCYSAQNMLFSTKCVIQHKICYSAQNMLFSTKCVIQHKMCILILSAFFWNISHSKKKLATFCHKCAVRHVNYQYYYCKILIKIAFSRQIFEKIPNIKFHENPSSGSG